MIRELDYRQTSYGLCVTLLWDDETNETFVQIDTEESYSRFPVSSEDASHAFAHPFVYESANTHGHGVTI